MFEGMNSDTMIGGRMGAASGLFAVDLDTYKDGAAGEAALAYQRSLEAAGLLPPTQTHATMSGGVHMIYESDHGYPNCKPSAGVEVKGEGGYIILPYSRGYSVKEGCGFTVAPKALIDTLMKARREHTAKTVDQHEEAIMNGMDFHDSITSMSAKLFRKGNTAAQVMTRIHEALKASVASSPMHNRHDRWKSIMADTSGELSRIMTSGKEKYDQKAKTQAARDTVNTDDAARIAAVAAAAGFGPSPTSRNEDHGPQTSAAPKIEYDGAFPFAGEGYYAHEELDVADQRFNIYPIFAENESVVVAADPKAGKTAICLKLAIQLAAGRSLGPFEITDRRAVLYFALEGTRAIKLRVEAEKRKMIDEKTPLPDDLPLFVVERGANFSAERDTLVSKVVASDRYFTEVLGIPMGLVVIDTLTKAMSGKDQNSVDDTSALFDFTTQLRAQGVTATVVFVHHTGKTGQTRGSTNIEAEPDLVLKMTKQEDGTTEMYVHMARSIDDNRTYPFRLEGYDLGPTAQGINLTAPVVTLLEGKTVEEHNSEDAKRAHKIAPFLAALTVLGAGVHSLKVVSSHLKASDLLTGRGQPAKLLEILALIFNRDLSVVYAQSTVTLNRNGDTITGITIK
tara:strand:+ start:14743 stop:16611 length:1869 start_codon:yes stop_codon:yes gene_type:complete